MIVDERVISYIHSLNEEEQPFLRSLYSAARKDHIPVIRRETQSFLKTLLLIRRPKKILEIGTAVGFSALLMGFYTEEDCRITSIEIDPGSARTAKENIHAAGMQERIEVICADAGEILPTLAPPFDLIFMDAAKAQYISYLPEVKRLMQDGSVLVSDNIFQEGDILESRFLIERRDRTIHKRMREYLYEIMHDDELCSSLIPAGDGLALSVMRR